jgi:hypothetical protein
MKKEQVFLPILIRSDYEKREGQIPLGHIPDPDTPPTYVRQLPSGAVRLFEKNPEDFKKEYGCVEEQDRELLFASAKINRAVARRDADALKTALSEWALAYRGSLLWDSSGQEPIGDQWMFEIGKTLNPNFDSVRLVFWWSETSKQLLRGFYCETLVGALALHWGLQMRLGVCALPECSNLMMASRPNKKYCSTNCQVRAAMRNYRTKKKRSSVRLGPTKRRRQKTR